MICAILLYREYRRQGLRRAWQLSGMSGVARQVAAGFLVGVSIVAAAAKLGSQAAEIDALRRLLAACLGEQEGSLFIDGGLYLCRAVPTGVRM